MPARLTLRLALLCLLSTVLSALVTTEVCALIFVGEGNAPINDPGWPQGAARIFNVESRIAWVEGPPFGGGQWTAQCRGDAKALSAVLADFAKLDVKSKRVLLHDGIGHAHISNPNNDPAKKDAAKMDWSFMVWQPGNWERLHKLPADINPTDPRDTDTGPPSQIDVYTGGNIHWADVIVPKGLDVDDQRLESHGFTIADGVVLEGKVTDYATKKPIAARMVLEKIETQTKGGYVYSTANTVTSDVQGHWVLKKAPAGSHRVVIEADGYVPRIIGYAPVGDQPQWQAFDSTLSKAAVVTGRVIDETGKPLAGAEARISSPTTADGASYNSPFDYTFKTDADGRFRAEQLPIGKVTIWAKKPGYVHPGLGESVLAPKENVELKMVKSAHLVVTVDFAGKLRQQSYLVEIAPVGGNVVGSWGGSGQINDKNQIIFDNVPPGQYTLHGQPNPTTDNEKTDPITIDLVGGQTVKVRIEAK